MITDLRFAFRQLGKSPGFTFLAVITLALGIGLNTAIFSLINDLFLRGLPFHQPERIVRIYGESRERELKLLPYSIPRFWHYRDGQTVFSGMAADNGYAVTLTGLGEAVQVNAQAVTANYFDVLGVRPIRGRVFLPQEEMNANVVMISENFWRRRLGSDPAVLGRSITLNDVPLTIVGVVPNMTAAWVGPDLEVFIAKPFDLPGSPRERLMRGIGFLRVIARLKPGVSLEQAKATMPALEKGYREQNPSNDDISWTTALVPIPEDVSGNLRPAFRILLGAVCFVLLIACSNVANLLLVRFSGRRREIALRIALGAARRNVVRLFIFESVLISLLGGALGALIAWKLIPLLPRLAANQLPLDATVDLSSPVLAFTLVLSVLTGVAMGFYPAWQSSRADVVDGLKDGGRAVSGGLHQQRLRKLLVGGQVALSVTLLAGAGLLTASFIQLSWQDNGFRAENLWTGVLRLPAAHYPDNEARARFGERLLQEIRNVPGVESAAIADAVPLEGGSRTYYARPDGNPPPVNQRPIAPNSAVSPGYFRAFGIPLIAGRDVDERDRADRPKVMLISKAGAKKIFPGQDPIGRVLLLGGAQEHVEIIGVVGDVRSTQLTQTDDAEFYRPWLQDPSPRFRLTIRGRAAPDEIMRSAQTTLTRLDAGLPIFNTATMSDLVVQAIGQQRLMMTLLAVFAGTALLLATVGIYGSVAHTVEQRTGEIGVRMALGAQTQDVLRLVVRQGMNPVILGLIIGLAGTFVVGRLLAAQLYQISPQNPILLCATAIVLAVAGLLACLIPARRATLVDPIEALRTE